MAAAACFCLQVNTAALVTRGTEENAGDSRMVAERRSTPGQRRGVVSPRAFPRRAEKRAQMLMSVGLGVDRACLPEGDEELRAPDRVSAETRRREKR